MMTIRSCCFFFIIFLTLSCPQAFGDACSTISQLDSVSQANFQTLSKILDGVGRPLNLNQVETMAKITGGLSPNMICQSSGLYFFVAAADTVRIAGDMGIRVYAFTKKAAQSFFTPEVSKMLGVAAGSLTGSAVAYFGTKEACSSVGQMFPKYAWLSNVCSAVAALIPVGLVSYTAYYDDQSSSATDKRSEEELRYTNIPKIAGENDEILEEILEEWKKRAKSNSL